MFKTKISFRDWLFVNYNIRCCEFCNLDEEIQNYLIWEFNGKIPARWVNFIICSAIVFVLTVKFIGG